MDSRFLETQRARWIGRATGAISGADRASPAERAASPREAEHVAGRLDPDGRRELQNSIHHGFSSGSTATIGRPNRVAADQAKRLRWYRRSTPPRRFVLFPIWRPGAVEKANNCAARPR